MSTSKEYWEMEPEIRIHKAKKFMLDPGRSQSGLVVKTWRG